MISNFYPQSAHQVTYHSRNHGDIYDRLYKWPKIIFYNLMKYYSEKVIYWCGSPQNYWTFSMILFRNQASKNIHFYSNEEGILDLVVWYELVSHTTIHHNYQGYNVIFRVAINLYDRCQKGLKVYLFVLSFHPRWCLKLQRLWLNFM